MDFPILIETGSARIPLHTLLETAGIFTGFRYFLYLRKKRKDVIEQPNRVWIVIGAIFGALLGSRLLGALENPGAWIASEHPLLYFYQNKTVVGGFLGGLVGVELMKKYIGEKKASGDLFVFPMILALIIGRIGCFSMGVYEETYGLPASLPWALDLGDGIPRHPVTLYEIIFLGLVWWVLLRTQKKPATGKRRAVQDLYDQLPAVPLCARLHQTTLLFALGPFQHTACLFAGYPVLSSLYPATEKIACCLCLKEAIPTTTLR